MKLLILLALVIITVAQTPSCLANEEFRTCGTACEPSCQNPEPKTCNLKCIVNMCQCVNGFVRGDNGCVRLQECYGK
ncbi:TIL domain-containing protein [Caenorhabditis elegans]|uniref:TIL domain-containing protein n=1 Tax=Caenorhabditis elegans TaxID=6239 RepID=Q7YWT3_CAEEL|nr:TIL domain-containing protein [Caenorhabditis elegans]CAE17955.1 TIL domain-containing protein [Caenorhabditis elegans]|eukprot:NP_001021738.1 Uncharacterized protein CELE_Y26D4A.12 [Caenorhabditis elegans]